MQTEQPDGRVVPAGWLRAFMDRADLERSCEELGSCSHFHAETLRGRIRSLQFEPGAARDHFTRALAGARQAPQTIANQIRKLILHVYWFENSLLKAPLSSSTRPPVFEAPVFSEEARREFPEIQLATNLRSCAEGLLRLHAGEWTVSARIYRQLIQANGSTPGPVLAGYLLGLVASQQNLGQAEDARRSFENTGLNVALEGATLTRFTVASTLCGAYRCLGDDEAADGWRSFLERLDCPRASKDAFLRRAGLVVER